ncbi:MAG: S41 family peptidase [Armatimonadota bacterium]|nr:S41 family peptidase [Armatimonadota bacterium]
MKKAFYFVLIIMLICTSFLCGFTYTDFSRNPSIPNLVALLEQAPSRLLLGIRAELESSKADVECTDAYWQIYSYISNNYFGKTPDPKQLTYSAIRGMLAALGDRYTRFLDPEQNKEMQSENRGDFEGIGAELDVKDGYVFIKNPLPNSPAKNAGLKKNDVILKVDDTLIHGMDIDEVVKRIRGPRGTKVRITIKREGVPEPMEFEITRQVIISPMVEVEMKDDESKIGYIALRQFNEKSDEQFDQALTKLEADKVQALILDLRNNPGGLLDVAVDIGSRFIDNGDIVIIQNKGGERTSLRVNPSQHNHKRYPLVVLINEMSASASEIVAGAIQDHKAGKLVGVPTFGKGLVQQIFNLEDGSAVAISTAKYLTPLGRDVDKQKIKPDVIVEPTDEDIKAENDVQLKKAIEILKAELQSNFKTTTARDHRKS